MSTKVDLPSNVESRQGQSTASISTSSSFSTSSPKVSMFGAKAGFVIPKNKLSGSLVPIFRGGSKVDAGTIAKEDSTKQIQRKTKWGADLTQDAIARKGKALAYQTRVEQITQQLKSGSPEFEDDQGSESPKHAPSADSASNHVDNKSHMVELLELERRELIGEILRLNPSYKAPPDYKPLLRESKVPIPIKAHPGYNFVGLLLGPESNTQKRLEEETGAKVRVYGTKSGLAETSEITKSDISEAQDAYDDLYVHVSADTYEKVDTAVALLELLLTPVSGNAGATPKVASSSAGINEDFQTKTLDSAGFLMTPPVTNVIKSVPQPSSLPVHPGQPPFQPYPATWFPATRPNIPPNLSSAFMPPLLPPNNPTQFPLLRPPPGVPQYFTQPSNVLSVPITSTPTMLRPPLPIQLPPNQSPSGPISLALTSVPVSALSPGQVNPQIWPPIRPLMTPAISSGWPSAPNAPSAGPNMNQMTTPPSNTTMRPLAVPSAPTSSGPSQQFNVSVANFPPHSSSLFSTRPSTTPPISSMAPSQTGLVQTPGLPSPFSGSSRPPLSPSSGSLVSPAPVASPRPTSFPQRAPAPLVMTPSPLIVRNPMPAPSPPRAQAHIPMQPRSQQPQPPPAISVPNSNTNPTFPPLANSPIGTSPAATPKPPRPISSDFTFQPIRAQPPSSPNTHPPHTSMVQNSPQVLFAAPQAPSFRPALQTPMPVTLVQISPKLQPIQHQPLPSETSILPTPPVTSLPPSPMLQRFPTLPPVQPVAPAIPITSPSFPRAAQAPNPPSGPPMPTYPTNFPQAHQNQMPHVSRPGGNFMVPNQQLGDKPIGFSGGNVHTVPGGSQIYDPFSPTASAPPSHQGANNPANRKMPETDAEYEDLMASVGVK